MDRTSIDELIERGDLQEIEGVYVVRKTMRERGYFEKELQRSLPELARKNNLEERVTFKELISDYNDLTSPLYDLDVVDGYVVVPVGRSVPYDYGQFKFLMQRSYLKGFKVVPFRKGPNGFQHTKKKSPLTVTKDGKYFEKQCDGDCDDLLHDYFSRYKKSERGLVKKLVPEYFLNRVLGLLGTEDSIVLLNNVDAKRSVILEGSLDYVNVVFLVGDRILSEVLVTEDGHETERKLYDALELLLEGETLYKYTIVDDYVIVPADGYVRFHFDEFADLLEKSDLKGLKVAPFKMGPNGMERIRGPTLATVERGQKRVPKSLGKYFNPNKQSRGIVEKFDPDTFVSSVFSDQILMGSTAYLVDADSHRSIIVQTDDYTQILFFEDDELVYRKHVEQRDYRPEESPEERDERERKFLMYELLEDEDFFFYFDSFSNHVN
jgi:hypothetical protein